MEDEEVGKLGCRLPRPFPTREIRSIRLVQPLFGLKRFFQSSAGPHSSLHQRLFFQLFPTYQLFSTCLGLSIPYHCASETNVLTCCMVTDVTQTLPLAERIARLCRILIKFLPYESNNVFTVAGYSHVDH